MPTVEPYTLELWPDRQTVGNLPNVTTSRQTNPIEEVRKDVSDLRTEVAELKGMLTAVLIALGNK